MTGPADSTPGTDVTVLETVCPYCGKFLDQHAAAGGTTGSPTEGAIGLCWGCGGAAMFVMNPLGVLTLRPLTTDEELEVGRNVRIARALEAMRSGGTPTVVAARSNEAAAGGDR